MAEDSGAVSDARPALEAAVEAEGALHGVPLGYGVETMTLASRVFDRETVRAAADVPEDPELSDSEIDERMQAIRRNLCLIMEADSEEELKWRTTTVRNPNIRSRNRTGHLITQQHQETQHVRFTFVPEAEEMLRFHLFVDSFSLRRDFTSAAAERTAQARLFKELAPEQQDEYTVTDAFVEVGRSGVLYIIRKNRPTIAFRPIPGEEEGKERARYLAALCLHPLGYYTGTWAGALAPSDEALAHLLMIRADEHGFWKKANQIPLTDPRCGI